jgi:hypothetical protein
MNNDSLMKYVKMSLFIILISLTFILVPSFALISSSQSNETLSNDTLSNDTLSDNSENDSPFIENETSFASLSRSLAETNQSEEEEPIPPPPPSDSGDEADQEADN